MPKPAAELKTNKALREWLHDVGCECSLKFEHTTSEFHTTDGVHPVDIVRIFHEPGCVALRSEDE